jgi:hypothetical protein
MCPASLFALRKRPFRVAAEIYFFMAAFHAAPRKYHDAA